MNPARFDRLAKSLGTARSRRTVLTTLGAAALGAIGLGRRSAVAQGTPPPATVLPGLAANNATLFVQTATGGTFAPNPLARAATPAPTPVTGAVRSGHGTYLLTLHGHSGQTVAFADRPARDFADVPTPHFFTGMGFTPLNPPNAALVATGGAAAPTVALVELLNPTYDAPTQTLTYEAELLHTYPNARGSALAPLADEARAGARPPATFGAASLFIDDCPDLTTCYNNYEPASYVGPLPGGPVGQCWQWGCLCCQPCNGKSTQDYGPVCKSAYPAQCSGELVCNAG